MARSDVIESVGVVAVVRLDDLTNAVPLTEALVAGGVSAVEFTFTNRLAARAVELVASEIGARVLVGAGSVLDPETARVAILSGAEFVVTPTLKPATIEMCTRYGVPVVAGGLTPTELLSATEAGARFVKIFPASLGGPGYLKDLLGPLPHLKLVPTGGIGADNAAAYIQAGACAVAVGSNLVDPKTVGAGEWSVLEERARRLVEAVRTARSTSASPAEVELTERARAP